MASTANQYALSVNKAFHQRVEMKILKYAKYVIDAGNRPPEEVQLARLIVQSQDSSAKAMRLARIIATDPGYDTQVTENVGGETITDAQIESSVGYNFLLLA